MADEVSRNVGSDESRTVVYACHGPTPMHALHPAVIHMPLVLVLLWPVIDGVGLKLQSPHLMRLGLVLLLLGALTSLMATVTGQAAFDEALVHGVDATLLRTHTSDADMMPWALLTLSALRAWVPTKFGIRGHAGVLVLGLLLWPFALGVGNSGGELVYEHGVGVWSDASDVAGATLKR